MLEMKPLRAIVLVLVVVVGQYASLASAAGPKVIIVGAGMSGKCLATTLHIAIDICVAALRAPNGCKCFCLMYAL
jgi:hypothetical protein